MRTYVSSILEDQNLPDISSQTLKNTVLRFTFTLVSAVAIVLGYTAVSKLAITADPVWDYLLKYAAPVIVAGFCMFGIVDRLVLIWDYAFSRKSLSLSSDEEIELQIIVIKI